MAGKLSEMTIYIMGSAGWIPGTNETSCIMVENRGELFILDAGTGMSNLRKYREVLDRYDTVHLLLSHYHLDHMIGLIYIDPFIREKRFRVYGPERMAYPETTEYYLHAFLRKEFFPEVLTLFPMMCGSWISRQNLFHRRHEDYSYRTEALGAVFSDHPG